LFPCLPIKAGELNVVHPLGAGVVGESLELPPPDPPGIPATLQAPGTDPPPPPPLDVMYDTLEFVPEAPLPLELPPAPAPPTVIAFGPGLKNIFVPPGKLDLKPPAPPPPA
jgi:hypothetical protein